MSQVKDIAFIFCYDAYISDPQGPIGPMLLSAVLKEAGYQVKGFAFKSLDDEAFYREIEEYNPQMVMVSSTTGLHTKYASVVSEMKKRIPGLLAFLGGPHATFSPDVIKEYDFDVICLGEGEKPMVEYLDALNSGSDPYSIKNLWLKKGEEIIKNDLRPFLTDKELDELPFPDYSLIACFPHLLNSPKRWFMAGRGCPFNCTYCFNHKMRHMTTGRYVRMRSPLRVIEEIEYEVAKMNGQIKFIDFQDDTFIFDKKWLKEFTELYAERIKLPYHCHIEMTLVTDEICEILQKSNCKVTTFGLENGNEKLRRDVLKKKITNDQIIKGGRLLKKYGLFTISQNMMSIPYETNDTVCDTMDLNRKTFVDVVNLYYYIPFPDTQLGELARTEGFLKDNVFYPMSYYENIALQFPYDQNFIELHYMIFMGIDFRFFAWLIRFAFHKSTKLRRLCRKLLNKVYFSVYNNYYLKNHKSSRPDGAARYFHKHLNNILLSEK